MTRAMPLYRGVRALHRLAVLRNSATNSAASAIERQQLQLKQSVRYFSWQWRNAQLDATQVLEKNRDVLVHWDDGHTSQYDFTWLRLNCPSFLTKSGQRSLFPGDVDPELKPIEILTPVGQGKMKLTWSDGHVSEYKADWLRAHDNSPGGLHERSHGSWPTSLSSWDSVPKVDGEAFLTNDTALYRALKKINRTGVCRLTNLGTDENKALDVARRIGPISHEMLYGDTFDVVPQDSPRNVAYTSDALRLHMDLVYYESPPGLQILHCIRFDDNVTGGESLLLDAFEAAKHFRDNYPEHFEVLSRVPATFHKVRGDTVQTGDNRNTASLKGAYMVYQRPHIQVDANGEILAVTWAPMFEGVLMCSVKDMGPYYRAYTAFQKVIEQGPFAEEHTLRLKLQPGHCMIFNNRRMLHGRTKFSIKSGSAGQRWLRGCYVNIDDAMSRLRMLHIAQPAFDDPADNHLKRAGNGSLAHIDY